MGSRASHRLLARGLAAALALNASLVAQDVKLSGAHLPGVAGDVVESRISPDARRVVFRADRTVDERFELFSVPIDGGPVVALAPPPVEGGDVTRFAIDALSARAVYLADQEADDVFELFSVPIDGGGVVRLSPVLVAGGDVVAFEVDPSGARVAFLADAEVDGVLELWSAPIEGGPATQLNGPLAPGGGVTGFRITADGSRAVYRADASVAGVFGLHSVGLSGGAPVVLAEPAAGPGVETDFEASLDGTRVVYRLAGGGLWSVSLSGGAAVELLPAAERFRISSDSARVVALATPHLLSVPLEGGAVEELDPPLLPGERVIAFHLSPDGALVSFVTELGDSNHRLFLGPIVGGPADVLVGGTGYEVFGGAFTPDSRRVLYSLITGSTEHYSAPVDGGRRSFLFVTPEPQPLLVAPDSTCIVFVPSSYHGGELFRVPITGGSAVTLNPPLVAGGGVAPFPAPQPEIAADSSRVVYLADQDTDDVVDLYSVPLGGGEAVRLDPVLAPGGVANDVRSFRVTPDRRYAVYTADEEVDERIELFAAELPTGRRFRVSAPLQPDGDVHVALDVAPDSRHVVYLADQDTDGVHELFSVALDGGRVVKLNAPLGPDEDVDYRRISPDSRHVAFTVRSPGATALFVAPIAGGAARALDAGNLADGPPEFTPDSRSIVYRAARDGGVLLYVVGVGGGAPERVSAPSPAGGSVSSFTRLLPDGSGVVYLGDLDTPRVQELYLSPLPAAGVSVKLNGPAVPGGNVLTFRVAPDSRSVVYRADETANEVYRLHRVALPSLERTDLVPTLVAGGDVTGFAFSPDSTRVVYTADARSDERYELFAVPAAGGEPTRLSGALGPYGDVGSYPGDPSAFAIGPDGRWVVYRANADRVERVELYRVAVEGGPVTKLNAPMSGGADVDAFLFSPDGRTVVYRADAAVIAEHELFAVSVEGGSARRLSGALPAHGQVHAFEFAGPAVVFSAEQELDGTMELYLSLLGRPTRRAR